MNLRHDLFRSGDVTFDDFCELVAEDQKADLLDGVIYMASPENTDANLLLVWLWSLMSEYANHQRLGKVFGSRVAFRIDEHNGPEPDIAFVHKRNTSRIERGRIIGPPDLAVEIVSPESVARDFIKKRTLYEQAGVREYWIIDQDEKKVLLLQRTAAGKYRERKPRRGVLRSQALSGFWLRLEWLWQDPRPALADALAEILRTAR